MRPQSLLRGDVILQGLQGEMWTFVLTRQGGSKGGVQFRIGKESRDARWLSESFAALR